MARNRTRGPERAFARWGTTRHPGRRAGSALQGFSVVVRHRPGVVFGGVVLGEEAELLDRHRPTAADATAEDSGNGRGVCIGLSHTHLPVLSWSRPCALTLSDSCT